MVDSCYFISIVHRDICLEKLKVEYFSGMNLDKGDTEEAEKCYTSKSNISDDRWKLMEFFEGRKRFLIAQRIF